MGKEWCVFKDAPASFLASTKFADEYATIATSSATETLLSSCTEAQCINLLLYGSLAHRRAEIERDAARFGHFSCTLF